MRRITEPVFCKVISKIGYITLRRDEHLGYSSQCFFKCFCMVFPCNYPTYYKQLPAITMLILRVILANHRGVSRTSETSKMESLIKIVNIFYPLTIVAELSILDVFGGPGYGSESRNSFFNLRNTSGPILFINNNNSNDRSKMK